ncbi:hypothetical protein HS041_30770 [Planomonospora sp. ID67723]|uniref:hypothetical protein n=1 Tax=Planomonospora sp. ID67723 TaxID=2738134 RepID=UPI0018C3CA09|nr:hypothetical protein [Planomonospora sp. ID67723]MBG0832091.1 hypothetical protein [Planomonospora sp. ID67723]
MRKLIQLAGIVMAVQGISGAVDRMIVQPFFGPILNFFNRVIVNRLDFLAGYELFANLSLAVLGVAVVIAADRTRPA